MNPAKSPSEIDRANRMFAIEQAVKLGQKDDSIPPVDHARAFHGFLSEGGPVEHFPIGFTIEDTDTSDAAKYL